MRKKTKSKSSNDLWLPFWTAVILLFACAVIHSILFYNNFFRALSKLNEEPIATITFKYKTAQRKFLARNIWDRLRQNSPVYNGDTIHTGALSEATIWFSDGNVMDLSENTMAQVFLNVEEGLSAELNGGAAVFDTTGSENGIKIKSGGVQVDIESGSSVSAGVLEGEDAAIEGGASEKKSFFQVLKGGAKIFSEGSERALLEGESANVLQSAGNSSSGVGAQNTSEQKILPPRVTVLHPTPAQKFLYHESGDFEVEFNWRAENIPQDKMATLVIASDKNFKNIVSETPIDFSGAESSGCKVSLAAKNYYWKIAEAGLSGKFQIVQALPPTLVAPVNGHQYSYSKKNPAARFIWSEVPNATSYLLEVAADESFSSPIIAQRNSSASSIISTLASGTYFWRVTPYFTINKTGYAAQSQTGFFEIEQKNIMKTPPLLSPANSAVVNTDSSAGGVSFSWKSDSEAESYIVVVSENEDLSQPFIKQTVKSNHFKAKNVSSLAKDGKWYWAVQSQDEDGNLSPLSATQTVFAMKGNPEQHTIEPVNGYKVSESFLADTRFTWKKSLPDFFESYFEIAEDSEFKKIVHSQPAAGNSAYAKTLPIGQYYWRLRSAGNEIVLATPPKHFSVVGNLEAANITAPLDRIVARSDAPAQFSWQPVPDADYYKIAIFTASGDTPLYTDTVYENRAFLDMFSGEKFSDKGYYKVQVQAFANAVPGVSSRRTGTLSSKIFLLRKLRPIEVEYPREGETLDGKDAIFNPKSALWNAVDSLSQAQFVLTKIDEGVDIIKIPSDSEFAEGRKIAPNRILLDTKDGLRPGKYQIIVYAKTQDGIDISNIAPEYKRTFNISPIPKLPASTSVRAAPAVFNAEYLRQEGAKKTISFEWNRVAEANEYRLSILKGEQLVLQKYIAENKFEIDFMALSEAERAEFSRGNFVCKIEAILRIDADGDGKPDKIFQDGIPASANFSADIPSPKKTTVTGAVNPYGK